MRFWKTVKKNVWLLGMLIGIAFLSIGAVQSQLAVIWRKATMICMECIGLG